MDIYSIRNKIKIITILKDTSLELSKASLLTPFYGTVILGGIYRKLKRVQNFLAIERE